MYMLSYPSILEGRIPDRLLLGPGPSNSPGSVLEATGLPLVGHLDLVFLGLLDEIQDMLRRVFRTTNSVTFAVSGTGSAGMETLAVNLFEPGDEVIVGRHGVFGGRIVEMLQKIGARPIPVDAEWGNPLDARDIAEVFERHPRVCALWVVHAETSTGVVQADLAELGRLAHARNALFVVDCVTSLGGAPVEIDGWAIDAAFSGTQKCLNVTPGLAPVTFGPRALEKIERRKTPVPSWYFDLAPIRKYWSAEGGRRLYHHTAPIASLYALHEGLRLVLEEGLEVRWQRHRKAATYLENALQERGFRYRVTVPESRLPMLHVVIPPDSLPKNARTRLLEEFGIEVGAGLGAWSQDTWRIGLMGINAQPEIVSRLLATIDKL